jgi:LytS/YehU family sensor histidine kinase
MNLSFFPHDQKFWLDHGLFMIFLAATQMIVILPLHEYARFLFFCDLFWFPFFTVAVLVFRYMFKIYEWHSLSSRQFLEYGLVYSLSVGLVIAIIISTIFSSFFWQEISSNITSQTESHLTRPKLMMGLILGNWIQTTIFISAWIFLYNSITSTKNMNDTHLRYMRAQHNLKEATLNSLSNQLNPHFLFNALNNIRFMIYENQKNADKMVTSLSEILRYSLESGRREKVCLAEEVNIIQRYIAVVASQLEERLHFELSIPDELHQYLVPPMIIQMLIENGVKHGLENIKRGGELSVTCEHDKHHLYFEVVNDIPVTQVDTLASTGIGLKNIQRRLELLYNHDAELKISKTTNKFIAKLTIPKELPR